MTVPRLVIAAAASGSGKTTVATGLIAAFRAQGLTVSGHKVGPDYIDPGYHAVAGGRPGRNLDPFLCGESLIGPLFAHGSAGAQIAIVEGVMGLFDGVADAAAAGLEPDYASTAHVARLLRAPVILVIDAAAIGRSAAAILSGFARFDARVRVAGVIFNRVGSQRHEQILRDAVAPLGMGVFGVIGRTDSAVTPARHLGLVPVAERRAAANRVVRHLATLVASCCDLDGLRAVAATAPPLGTPAWAPAAAIAEASKAPPAIRQPVQAAEATGAAAGAVGDPVAESATPVVAVAEGPAFTFSYTEHAELLQAAGVRLAAFDPLTDSALPPGTSGLIIGGGFPEMYAPQLSENVPLRRQVRGLAASGAPIAAECAGLLYLARTLDGLPMCGVIDATARMTPRLTLGYRSGTAASDSVLARAGETVRGHEFHRTVADLPCAGTPAWLLTVHRPAGARAEGHVAGNVLASYLHTHWARTPSFAVRFATACRHGSRHPRAVAAPSGRGHAEYPRQGLSGAYPVASAGDSAS